MRSRRNVYTLDSIRSIYSSFRSDSLSKFVRATLIQKHEAARPRFRPLQFGEGTASSDLAATRKATLAENRTTR